jgi:hypothetical protein
MTTKPKLREIFAADFRDRIVHHTLVDYLEKIWEPKCIFDSYACRKDKGIHLGVKRLRGFLRKVTRKGSRGAFYLQLDIKNFFMSIDKNMMGSGRPLHYNFPLEKPLRSTSHNQLLSAFNR